LRFETEARRTLVDERRAREKEQHQQAKDRPKQRGEERARREAERAARDAQRLAARDDDARGRDWDRDGDRGNLARGNDGGRRLRRRLPMKRGRRLRSQPVVLYSNLRDSTMCYLVPLLASFGSKVTGGTLKNPGSPILLCRVSY
jgi:hypothetical protein